jgi:hypothetical protein
MSRRCTSTAYAPATRSPGERVGDCRRGTHDRCCPNRHGITFFEGDRVVVLIVMRLNRAPDDFRGADPRWRWLQRRGPPLGARRAQDLLAEEHRRLVGVAPVQWSGLSSRSRLLVFSARGSCRCTIDQRRRDAMKGHI